MPFGGTPTRINGEALRKIYSLKRNNTKGKERLLFFTNTGLFKVHYIEITDPELINPNAGMTLEYPEDYEFFKRIFLGMDGDGKYFSLREILVLLKEYRVIIEINKKIQSIYEQRYNE